MRRFVVLPAVAGLLLAACSSGGSKKTTSSSSSTSSTAATQVTVKAYSPEANSVQGVCGNGIVIDLAIRTKDPSLLKAAIRAAQPGQPGRNPAYQNLVVTLSTTEPALGGPQANIAGLFQIVSVSQQSDGSGEIWVTWVNGQPRFGVDVDSTLDAYVVNDPAPATVTADRSGLNVVSNVEHVPFHIAGSVGSTPCAATATTASGATSTSGRTTTTAHTTTSKATTTTVHTTTSATAPPTSAPVTP
jgi:hypothetical protein